MAGQGRRFLMPTIGFCAALLGVVLAYILATQGFGGAFLNAWDAVQWFVSTVGSLLAFSTFVGGVSSHRNRSLRRVALPAVLLAVISYGLLGYARPLARFQAVAAEGTDLSIRYPFGPETPQGLKKWRSAVRAAPSSTGSDRIKPWLAVE